MADYEIDSFVLKFKNLLFAGNNANLTIKSEAGKCLVNLSVEVDITLQPSGPQIYQHRHIGPARQRRHARREAARIADEAIAVVEVRNSEEESQAEKCNEETVVEAAEANNEETEKSEATAKEVGDHRNEPNDHSSNAKAEYSCELCDMNFTSLRATKNTRRCTR